MPDIPIRITTQGLEGLDRIDKGLRKIRAGASAPVSGGVPRGPLNPASYFPGVPMGNFGSGFTPGGWDARTNPRARVGHSAHESHGGFRHGLHGLTRGVGGAAGVAGERLGGLGALAGLGPMGLAIGAAALATNIFINAMEHGAERAKAVFEQMGKYADIARNAALAKGQMGLEAAGQGGGYRQVANLGLMKQFEAARAGGFTGSAESFASLRGDKSKLEAVRIAHMLGVDDDTAAKMAMHMAGGNAQAMGRFIAGQSRGYAVTDSEMARARKNQTSGAITTQLNAVERLQGKTSNVKTGYLRNGDAVTAAQRGLTDAANPAAQGIADLALANKEQAEMFKAMSENSDRIWEITKQIGRSMYIGPGSYAQQAQDVQQINAAAQLSQ